MEAIIVILDFGVITQQSIVEFAVDTVFFYTMNKRCICVITKKSYSVDIGTL